MMRDLLFIFREWWECWELENYLMKYEGGELHSFEPLRDLADLLLCHFFGHDQMEEVVTNIESGSGYIECTRCGYSYPLQW